MMNNELTEQQVFQKLSALCARAEHCQWEMLEKMRQWGVDEEMQARVMERLVNERYVDDRRYAEAFVRDKVRYNQWGRRKVEQALWLKHIDGDVARQALDAIDENEYVSILKPLVAQKRRTTKARNDYELNMKLMKWAMGRGFTMDIIRQCIAVDDD
jgi:regulatory protein